MRNLLLTVILISLLGLPCLALHPPRQEQDTTGVDSLECQERARRLGNHKIAPFLAERFRQQIQHLLLQQGWGYDATEGGLLPGAKAIGLPTTGENKVFALLIDFADYPPYNTPGTIDCQLFGEGTGGFPYESMKNYYLRASYNQLTIEGTTLGWYTTPYPRSDVLETTNGRQNLIKEALQYIDGQGHDFSQYDNNNDGFIDYFLVIWTGPHGSWASFWWGYLTFFQDQQYTLDGKHLSLYSWQWEAYDYPGPYDPITPMHETGHALGLPDYYDYDGDVGPDGGVGGLDMMDGCWGDHCCFSKFILGWLTPTVVSAGSDTVTLQASGESGDALLIMPSADGDPYAEYFMVQNRMRVGNDVDYPTDGLLIWHVDARVDGYGYFRYDNSYTDHKLLRLMEADGLEEIERGWRADAGDFYTPGDAMTPLTLPNSHGYQQGPTGIGVDNISDPGATMTCSVTTESSYTDPAVFAADIGYSPAHPSPGDMVELTVIVHNLGNETVDYADLEFSYFDGSDVVIATPCTGSIPAGGQELITANWDTTGLQTTAYPLTVTISASVPEHDARADNNSAVLDFPLPVELAWFNALAFNHTALIRWQTLSETDNLGWNVYRTSDGSPPALWRKVNTELIPGQGTSSQPHAYRILDAVKAQGPTAGPIGYVLESLSVNGQRDYFFTELKYLSR